MNATATAKTIQIRSAVEIARELGPVFAKRANEATDEDRFVADNFAT